VKFFVKVNCTLFALLMVVGILSVSVFASESQASSVSSYPSSCQAIHDKNPAAADGDYIILSDSHIIKLYCANMSTAPAEYLSLVQTGGSYNYSKAAAGSAWTGTDVITKYTKVRFDPTLARIIHTDRTFSSSTGSINGGQLTSMNYGSAVTCTWNPQLGTANLNLTGTDLTFALNQFISSGWEAGGTNTYSNGNQVVNLTGGGYCGGTNPINPYIQLNWQYQPLAVSATPVNVDGKSTVTATLKDAAGSPVANANIRFNSSLGNIDSESVTDAYGVATAVFTLMEAGTAQIEAVSATGGSYGKTSVEVEVPTQTLIIYGANGVPGETDAHTEYSLDGGETWQSAYLYGSHPWGFVPGTNSWLNCAPSGQACLNMDVLYRIQFNVPDNASNAEMKFDIKADNYATIWLNDTHVADIEGQNSTDLDASIASVIQPGLNEILLNVKDTGGWAGLNYKITLNITAPTPPVLVDPAPAAKVDYSTTAPTNGDIVASIIPSESVTITNNDGSASYTFSENGSFTFEFVDSAGNTGEAVAIVSNIDKVAPVITIDAYNTNPTKNDITVTASTNEGTLNAAIHTFTENGEFTFTATDAAGNVANKTVTITNIDKTPPVITVGSYTTDPTNKDVVVMVSTNEGTLNVASHTFTKNGEFTFTATDAAGNVTNKTVTITNIDKVAPTLTVQANKNSLVPPNHKLVDIGFSWIAQDNGSGIASVKLISVTSNEPDNGLGDGDTSNDIQGADIGTDDQSIQLRAERSGNGTGRVYTITYKAVDFAGNSVTASTTVTVPHSSK
jgi:hypothetical protein